MPIKLAILHFNILEKYPPAMNLIRDLEGSKKEIKLMVISTKNITSFSEFTTSIGTIFRLGTISQSRLTRYTSYLIFNLLALIRLIRFKPKEILVFETLSIWPVYFYNKINRKVNIHFHHHEYASLEEIYASSAYVRFLHKKEQQLLQKATFSHTNEDRKEFYLKDHPNLNGSKIEIYPNFPPQLWWDEYGTKKKIWQGPKIKLVYVGALDLETMYVREVVEWVLSNPDQLELTFISQQTNAETLSYIQRKKGDQIKLIEPINYENLPSELIKYDVGIFIYKGVNKNHIYSVPNKVFEYLYCGLKVLGDNSLKSTSKLNHSEILLINFKEDLKSTDIITFIQKPVQLNCLSNNSLSKKYS